MKLREKGIALNGTALYYPAPLQVKTRCGRVGKRRLRPHMARIAWRVTPPSSAQLGRGRSIAMRPNSLIRARTGRIVAMVVSGLIRIRRKKVRPLMSETLNKA